LAAWACVGIHAGLAAAAGLIRPDADRDSYLAMQLAKSVLIFLGTRSWQAFRRAALAKSQGLHLV
jgi:hypothetical protein